MPTINGTDLDDFRVGTLGNDVINMFAGDDFIAATSGIDVIDGGDGTDQINVIMSNAGRFAAATGSRTYTLTANSISDSSGTINTSFTSVERIFMRTDNTGNFGDTINASGLTPASSGTTLFLRAGAGNDTIIGSAGDDDLGGGLGINTIDAGLGYDTVTLRSDSAAGTVFVTMLGGALITTVNGVQTNSVTNAEIVFLASSDPNAPLTTVDASGVTGFTGTLLFYDSNGSNIAIGSAGADIFANVPGAEAGNDVYTGGGGADTFDYTYAVGSMNGDSITDFGADDVIDLRFNNPTDNVGGLLAYQFIGAAAFTNVAGQYRYLASGGQTFIQVDTNGDTLVDETLTIANGQFALGETFAGSNILRMIGTSGTSLNDTLTGTLGNDSIYAQQGSDIINGSQGTDFINGGNGVGDRLFMNTGTASLFTAATGPRTYTIGANTITDSSGTLNTTFTSVERVAFSNVGNGDFDDVIDASGFVSAHASALDVRLGNGDNQVTGSGSNDRVFTGFGSTIADGGAGYDLGYISVDTSGPATVTITSVGGAIVTTANGVTNTFTNFEEVQVFGVGSAALTLDASGFTAIPGTVLGLTGHNGTDIMIGSAGNDYFGNITGQILGSDVYTGNGGADIYDYTYAADSMNGDTITDFDIDDVIDMRFNNLEPGGSPLLANHFIGAAAFSGTAGEYRYQINGTQTVVQVDSDGNGTVDQTLTIANGAFALDETFAGSNILTLASVIDPLAGVVGDGYIEGATLFVDTNGNKIRDPGEAWTVTGPGGSFSLNVNQAGTIVAIGGTNLDTGLANTMTLTAPSGADVVNPLTTLVQAVVEQGGGTAAQAQAKVLAALGLSPTIDLLTYDLLAHGNDPSALAAQKAAAMVANLVAAAEGTAGSTATTEGALVGALAALVVSTGAGTTIDLADAATLTPLLTTALPGVTNVSAVANEVAVESEIISNATTLSGIATAQLSAHDIDYSIANILTGDSGDNHLSGLGGNDTLSGLAGNDRLEGGIGDDQLEGGSGNDILSGDGGNDTAYGGDGNDMLRGGDGNDLLYGELNDDQLYGGAGNDYLDGGLGNDRLFGGVGSDRLVGGSGNDILAGGEGTDKLTGSSGSDIFIFTDSELGTAKFGNHDVITDFHQGVDKIDLSALYDGGYYNGLKAAALSGSADAYKVGFYSQNGKTWLEGDTDGNGIANFVIEVIGSFKFKASDFIVSASLVSAEAQWTSATGGLEYGAYHQDAFWI